MVKLSPAPRHYAGAEPVLEGEVLDKNDDANIAARTDAAPSLRSEQ